VFIGSCTNGRCQIFAMRPALSPAARCAVGSAWVVPGSEATRHEAEREGLDKIFKTAGFEWRAPGCSMCLGANGDIVGPGERSVSTTNRNFVGRQGPNARTHLASPVMAAAAAVAGRIADAASSAPDHEKVRPPDRHRRAFAARNVDTEVVIRIDRLIAHRRGELGPLHSRLGATDRTATRTPTSSSTNRNTAPPGSWWPARISAAARRARRRPGR